MSSDVMKSIALIAAVAAGTIIAVNYASNKNAKVAKFVNPGK